MKQSAKDSIFKEMFKRDLPDAPENPWFVRKVLNRLPARKASASTAIEYTGFLAAAVILGCFWYRLIISAGHSDVITVGDIAYYCILTAMTFSLAIGFTLSFMHKG
ncbi:MAG: hypothetical protein IJY31_02915 [Muribaculaceae bacterium]|nr:hypothetical protein [Muribaculaceae bacterium]